MGRRVFVGFLLFCAAIAYAEESILELFLPSETSMQGKMTLSYKAEKKPGFSFFDPGNNGFSATVTLATRLPLNDSWGVGFEAAGWSDLGLKIADYPRVSASITNNIGYGSLSGAEISQSYLSYRYGEIRIRLGRQAGTAFYPW